MKRTLITAATLAFAYLAFPPARAERPGIADRRVCGEYVSLTSNKEVASGKEIKPYGDNPKGLPSLHERRAINVVLVADNRAKPASAAGTTPRPRAIQNAGGRQRHVQGRGQDPYRDLRHVVEREAHRHDPEKIHRNRRQQADHNHLDPVKATATGLDIVITNTMERVEIALS